MAILNVPRWRANGRSAYRHLPGNDSSLNGDVSMGDNLGTLIFMKPKPVDSLTECCKRR